MHSALTGYVQYTCIKRIHVAITFQLMYTTCIKRIHVAIMFQLMYTTLKLTTLFGSGLSTRTICQLILVTRTHAAVASPHVVTITCAYAVEIGKSRARHVHAYNRNSRITTFRF